MANSNQKQDELEHVPILAEALRYRTLGWSVVPIDPESKSAAVRWKRFQTERPRERDIRRWFVADDRGIAAVLGEVSGGLCCRDFDEAGAYRTWACRHRDFAETLPTSQTGRGFHVWFRTDGRDSSLPNKGVLNLGDGELRIRRCHSMLPPSRHPSGGRYRWLREPFHGVPIVHSAEAAGLVFHASENDFSRCTRTGKLTSHPTPLHTKKPATRATLFVSDGTLSVEGFDSLLEMTLPTGPGQREHHLWMLARCLKGLDETKSLRADALLPVVRRWWQLALPKIRTKEWFETWAAFVRCWERVTTPLGEGEQAMGDILDRARRAGCPASLAADYGRDVCGLVAAICRELSLASDDRRFWLDSRTLARLCGIDQPKASACLRALTGSRAIRRVAEPRPGRASEYVWLLP